MARARTKRMFTKADGYTTAELLRFARDHLASARVLRERSFDCFDSAGVLCHVGLELVLKALLLHSNAAFPKTHDLKDLLDGLATSPQAVRMTQNEHALVAKIDSFFSLRYPQPSGSPDIGDEDLVRVEELVVDLVRQLPIALRAEFTKLRPYEKGGRLLMRKPKAKA